jgi:hypothetical protein
MKRFAIILVLVCAFMAAGIAARPLLAGSQDSAVVKCCSDDSSMACCCDKCKKDCDGTCCDMCKEMCGDKCKCKHKDKK